MRFIEKTLSLFFILCVTASAGYFIAAKTGIVTAGGKDASDEVFYTQSYVYRNTAYLKVKISGSGGALLLVNGEPASYEKESEYISLEVADGDIIGIDCRAEPEKEVTFFVADADEDIVYPRQGTKLFVKGGVNNLFEIRINNNN